jgi:hypothetical protein
LKSAPSIFTWKNWVENCCNEKALPRHPRFGHPERSGGGDFCIGFCFALVGIFTSKIGFVPEYVGQKAQKGNRKVIDGSPDVESAKFAGG